LIGLNIAKYFIVFRLWSSSLLLDGARGGKTNKHERENKGRCRTREWK
jgi:hypothetical protein